MVTSQNGYSANDRSQIVTYQIGGKTKVALRKGPTGWLLQHLGNWFDANIRDIDPGILDDWGYAERPIRGGVELSNHASGTALDVDATKWPLGVEPTNYLTKAEIARLKQHLTVYEGAIRWGGDYIGRKDPMHFEIDKPEPFCARIQAKLQAAPGYTPPTSEEDDMAQADIDEMQRKLSLLLAVPGTPRDPRERTPGQQVMETPIKLGDGQETNFGSLWPELFGNSRAVLTVLAALRGGAAPDVDEAALAAALAPLLTSNLGKLSDADVDRIKVAVADEQARRQAS